MRNLPIVRLHIENFYTGDHSVPNDPHLVMVPPEEHIDEEPFQEKAHHVSQDRHPTHFPEHAIHLVQKLQKYVVGAEQDQYRSEVFAFFVESEVGDRCDVEDAPRKQKAQDDIKD